MFITSLPETKNSGTLKKIGGHALQINAFFVSISYNNLLERHDALISVTAAKRNKGRIMREQPYSLITLSNILKTTPLHSPSWSDKRCIFGKTDKKNSRKLKIEKPSRGPFLGYRR